MVRNLIRIAFNVQAHQIVGGPAWLDSERFDNSAKSSDADLDAKGMMPPEQFMLRLQALLEERFAMKTHWETRQVPAFALIVAADGRLGPALKAHTGNCDPESNGIVPPPGSPTSHCVTSAHRTSASATVIGTGIRMDTLARNLSSAVGRTVTDRTGLSGIYDVHLTFIPEPSPEMPGPSLFTAVQEKLGLRLEPERAPIRVLVIDGLDRPTSN